MLWSLLDRVVILLSCKSESNPTGIKSACNEFKRRNKNCQELKRNYQRMKICQFFNKYPQNEEQSSLDNWHKYEQMIMKSK